MNKILLYVSLLAILLAFARAEESEELALDDLPEGITIEGEGDNKVITISKEKAKREGWLPWEEWYDTDEYHSYKQLVVQFFSPIGASNGFYSNNCPNITWMSQEKYEYYIRNFKESVIDENTTTVVVMGQTHTNETMWVTMQI